MLKNTTFDIGQGDTDDPLYATLYMEGTTTPIDLTNVDSVKFSMRTPLGDIVIDEVDAEVVGEDQKLGRVRYLWHDGDTDIAGTFQGRFRVYRDGKRFYAPNKGYIRVNITPF